MSLLQQVIRQFLHKITDKNANDTRMSRLFELDQKVVGINDRLNQEIIHARRRAEEEEQTLSRKYLREYLTDRGQ